MHLSVIVPTFNEADNIEPLIAAIDRALTGIDYQIVFADDSADATTDIIRRASDADPRIRLSYREAGRGLASAVVAALPMVTTDTLAVMDGDLQHPPEILPRLLERLQGGADLVVASRYAPGGWDSGLSGPQRRLASKVTRLAAYLLLPVTKVTSDPLSGYFLFKRSVIENAHLRPLGYKILLEILVRGHARDVADIPFAFERRHAEQSKAGLREAWNYLRQLWRLRS